MFIYCGDTDTGDCRVLDTSDGITEVISQDTLKQLRYNGVRIIKNFNYDYAYETYLYFAKANLLGLKDWEWGLYLIKLIFRLQDLKYLKCKLPDSPYEMNFGGKYQAGGMLAVPEISGILILISKFGVFFRYDIPLAGWYVREDETGVMFYRDGRLMKVNERNELSVCEDEEV